MKSLKALLLLLALGLSVYGQAVNVTANKLKGSATAPSGSCSAQQVHLTTAGVVWTCQSGTWGSSGGGSGTPGGASGTLQYNNGGNFGAVTSSSVSGANITLAGTVTIPTTTSSSTGVIYKGATAFLHNYNPSGSDGGNVFIGGAGNFTMAWGGVNSYEAARNTIVGEAAGTALTTGYFNNILGYETCRVCTSAAGTSVIGARAMYALTTGHDNAGVGDNTLYSVTTGERNGGFVYRALYNLVTGDENAALGYGAGYNLTSGSRNTFLGTAADVTAGAASGLTNSTAIGNGATVTASNQIVLGNNSVTETKINGTVTMLNTGANMRMTADGTSAKDGGIYVGSGGDIYFANWAATRGWLITSAGAITQLGTGQLTIGGPFTADGVIKSGSGATASVDPLFLAARTINTGTGNAHSFSDSSTFARPVDATAYNSFDARVTISGTNNYDHYAAFQSAPTYSGSGTTTYHFGLYDAPAISAGTLTNRYGAYIVNPSGAGAVTNNYGVYVESQTKGTTLNYAIFTEGTTPSIFGGAVTATGTAHLNGTGGNLRLKADGTTAKDGGIFVNASGDITYGNWDANRGWSITSSGAINQLGSGAVTLNGSLQSGAFTVSTVTASGLILANATGGNIRIRGNNTTATDGAVLANSAGVLYFSNWDLDRGWLVTATGAVKSLGGDIAAVASSAHGLVLKSPDGTCYRATMANGGTFSIASITCP